MKITIVGTGYVGLVTGTCLAETGNDVLCIDIDEAKVAKLKNAECPIYEPGLKPLLERNIEQGRLSFSTSLIEGINHGKVLFLALPTPPGEDGSADLSYVLGVADNIGKNLKEYRVIVDKSTVPVGTADKVSAQIAQHTSLDFDVVSNPEFLREGMAVDDFLKPSRVVIGTSSEKAADIMRQIYEPYVRQGHPIIVMDERSAEMTKYAANSFLATKISFMNEVANLCEVVGANVDNVRIGMAPDDRIGRRFLFAGVGYGGSCFPKDVLALHKTSKDNDYEFKILDAVIKVNYEQRARFYQKIHDHFDGDLKGMQIALWGLAFKPETDDIREAPALYIIDKLLEAGAKVKAYDPEAMDNVKALYGDRIDFCDTMYDTLEASDFLVIVTEWSAFRQPDFDKIKDTLKLPLIFDGRNLYDKERIKELGIVYQSIGRP
ncbi:MAG: UDP-glucose/GDP-mannose dehydrogenase family protein [Bacteroidota bacterium]|nr:UDP-glucose/GDP-mannose dehydrogenase family protein [Bacteroidota bacterium]MEC8628226.1 UDP-glucose/GDP-mannose dehydrogenase family protein [Bacteroidota bacterium]MEC9221799.1 UDP-glucose/GDP-mannose dehydrogenase family protein [Bacteroidota bacterium]